MMSWDSGSDKLKAVFDIMDGDGGGFVSKQELTQFLNVIAPSYTLTLDIQQLAESIMLQADVDKDGLINHDEVPKHSVLCNSR